MEQRAFAIDPALLYSVIQSQAGTLEKALLEGVMNSVDAGSTRVAVSLTETQFVIRDNGRGFRSREEIVKWFETFGTPHQEGDATFGRFRMGRGQMMAFASTVWQSGAFQMTVDIRESGLGYGLATLSPSAAGCSVVGQLYQSLTEARRQETEEAFRKLVAYCPVPVELNGKVVSIRPEKAKWGAEDDACWLQLDPDARELLVYNQGVLVKSMPGWRFGSGGVVVSRRPLKVNFARNDILEYECPQWELVRAAIERGVMARLSSRKQLSDDQRAFLARKVLGNRDGLDHHGLTAKIFTDVQGKHVALVDVLAAKSIAVESASRPQLSRAMHDSGTALVLSRKSLDRLGATSLDDLVERLSRVPDVSRAGLAQLDIDKLPFRTAGPKDRELPREVLHPKETAALRALDEVNAFIGAWLQSRGWADRTRELRVGVRAGAVAWTDGAHYIYAHRKYLRQLERGLDGAGYWVATLIHEYCHDTDDSESHDHGEVFYAKYHEWTSNPSAPMMRAALRLQAAYVRELRALRQPAGRLLTKQLKGTDI
jgi:hypothetical protein